MKKIDKRSPAINETWTDPEISSDYWLKLRRILFPIELFLCFLLFSLMSTSEIYKQYIFQTLAKDTLASSSNYSNDPNISLCLRQDYIVNQTGSNATFLYIQKRANIISMYCEIVSLGTSAIVALFYGPLSDKIGRKPILWMCSIGALLSSIVILVVVEVNINIYWLLLAVGIFGVMGGASTVLGVSFAAVSDVTSQKWRTVRMGTTESAIGFGKASSYLAVFIWIKNNGCDFRGPTYLLVGSCLITFIYLAFMPESLPQSEIKSNNHGFRKIINGLRIFFVPTYLGYSKWWRVCICVLIISIACLCLIGAQQIITFFLHDKPLEWSYDTIGYYGLISSASTIVALILFLPILVRVFRIFKGTLNISNQIIYLISVTVAIAANICIAIVQTNWEMFLITGFQGIQQIGFPALRAILSELVDSNDYGSVLAITASVQMLASVGSTVLFNEVYHPQAVVNGHTMKAGMVFWIAAGFWATTIPLVLLLFKKIPNQSNESKHLITQEKQKYQTL